MAVKTLAIVEGAVMRIEKRSGKTKDDKDWAMTQVLIVGDDTLCQATLARGVTEPGQGEYIRAQIEVGVYRDDDSVTLVKYLDLKGAK